jgi:tetrahydromethanopterin S-methyltransferase subunit G
MPTRETSETKIALIQQDISYMKDKLDNVDQKISTHYVSREEFEPIKKIVYGMVGLVLVAVVGALISLVVKG